MTTACIEVDSVPGAWNCPLQLPATPFPRVREVLSGLARTGWPVAAFCYGGAGEFMTELLLCRDPRRTHGTPTIAESTHAVSNTRVREWRDDNDHEPQPAPGRPTRIGDPA